MSIITKFEVASKTEYCGSPSVRLELHAVPGTENNSLFSKSTPSGRIELMINNESGKSFFQTGKSYYVTFVAEDDNSDK